MARFKVIGMNWGLLFASLATRATIWFQQALHSGLASQMAKEEENGQRQILSANVRALWQVAVNWKGGPDGKILGSRWWRTDRVPEIFLSAPLSRSTYILSSDHRHSLSSSFLFARICWAVRLFPALHTPSCSALRRGTLIFFFFNWKRAWDLIGCLQPCRTYMRIPHGYM